MEEIVDALVAQQSELWSLVTGLDDDALRRPTRCSGWSVTDVLLHLAQTNELAVASTGGRFDTAVGDTALGDAVVTSGPIGSVDDWAAAAVDAERGADPAAVRDRWRASADAQVAGFLAGDPRRRVRWVAGDLAARTLATTRLAETWIHTGDVASGLGVDLDPTDRLRPIARLAWRTIPYAFERAGQPPPGPVAFHLRAPDGSPWDFVPDAPAAGADPTTMTIIRGDAIDLCLVAGRRGTAAATGLTGEGPDAAAVLDLVRTFA